MKRKKAKYLTHRVSVTLPEEMVYEFKEKSKMTGLSISKLIYYRLRSNKPIIIVPQDVQNSIGYLVSLIKNAERTKNFNPEIIEYLKEYLNFVSRFVSFDKSPEYIEGRK